MQVATQPCTQPSHDQTSELTIQNQAGYINVGGTWHLLV
jgi:hypothetical protein